MSTIYCPRCGGAGRKPGERACWLCRGKGRFFYRGDVADLYEQLRKLEESKMGQLGQDPAQQPAAAAPAAAPPPAQTPPPARPQAPPPDPQPGFLSGGSMPSLAMAGETDDVKNPSLKRAWVEHDAHEAWPGPWIFTSNSYIMVAAKVEGNVDLTPDIPEGPIGRRGLKLVERSRRFSATETRLEPFADQSKGEDRLVVMRPQATDADNPPDWGQLRPVFENLGAVTFRGDLLIALINALGAQNGGEITFIIDRNGFNSDDVYLRAALVQAPDGTEAEALIMPVKRGKPVV